MRGANSLQGFLPGKKIGMGTAYEDINRQWLKIGHGTPNENLNFATNGGIIINSEFLKGMQ